MKKAILGILVTFGLGYSQTVVSKLNGKRIYMQRQDAGHQDGYDGLRAILQANAAAYGYTFEYSVNPLAQAALDAVCSRLYPSTVANKIDILIFCQGEGDRNVAGNPFPNSTVRFGQVNAHVRAGGGLIIVHAAGGREVSWQSWTYGAKLMTDWFMDGYFASTAVSGNGGHFGAGTAGTMTMDAETLPARDSSTYFIRNVLTLPVAQRGYAQPLVTTNVVGEWYHFNGGKQYENGTGTNVVQANNRWAPKAVRGDPGFPDSGIGPAKIISILTNIQGANYTPPAPGRHSVWAREVSQGIFSTGSSALNGRFSYFNPGHQTTDYSAGGNYFRDLFLSVLRWVAKDDRGCRTPTASNFNSLATVNDGSCLPVSIGRDGILENKQSEFVGKVSLDRSGISVSVGLKGDHTVLVSKVNGQKVFHQTGNDGKEYKIPGLENGFYVVRVEVGGQVFKKLVSIQ